MVRQFRDHLERAGGGGLSLAVWSRKFKRKPAEQPHVCCSVEAGKKQEGQNEVHRAERSF
jgi:hypothetical protein